MRGSDKRSGDLFSYVNVEDRVRRDHPLRAIGVIANAALTDLSAEFAALYSGMGRPSIAPEMLLRAMLLQAFYSVRSERQLMERLEFDLLFRWFVGIGADEPAWDHSVFSKNVRLRGGPPCRVMNRSRSCALKLSLRAQLRAQHEPDDVDNRPGEAAPVERG
jgi:transposase